MTTLNAKAVEEKLREFGGNMAAVARSLGVTRGAVWIFVRDRPTLQRVVLDCREARIDVAESALDRAVLNGEGWAISLTLKTIGKQRGYFERHEVSSPNDDDADDDLLARRLRRLAQAQAAQGNHQAGTAERPGESLDNGRTGGGPVAG
jgi:hypothetical protein